MIVVKSYLLQQAVGMSRYGSLININPSGAGITCHILEFSLLFFAIVLFRRDNGKYSGSCPYHFLAVRQLARFWGNFNWKELQRKFVYGRSSVAEERQWKRATTSTLVPKGQKVQITNKISR